MWEGVRLPMFNSFFQNGIIFSSLLLCLVGQGLAVDRYVLDVPKFVMVGDSEIFVTVTPMSGAEVDRSPHTISFLGLPSGVRIAPLAGASSSLSVTGSTLFRLVLDTTLSQKSVVCRVQQGGKPNVLGTGFFNLENTVDHFQITPAGMAAPQMGVPFPFQIVAMDEVGAVVRSYKDPLEFKVTFGSVQEALVPGDTFKDGVAVVSVTFGEADPPGRLNRFFATAQRLYPGQTERAMGSIELTVQGKP
jgi:hypothetical protein